MLYRVEIRVGIEGEIPEGARFVYLCASDPDDAVATVSQWSTVRHVLSVKEMRERERDVPRPGRAA